MRIAPLVRHAASYIPGQIDMFSDTLDVSTIDVVDGGTTTINTNGPHGFIVGKDVAIAIVDAETPNVITGAVINADDTVTLTTQDPHDLSMTPDANKFRSWHTSVKLDGFGDPLMDGVKQLVSVDTRTSFTMFPSAVVGMVTIDGGEVLLERLERDLIGWHKATVATATTLTIPTPATVSRSYTVTSPVVVRGIRIFGSVHMDAVIGQYVDKDNTATPVRGGTLFITPIDVRTSRSRKGRTDAIAEINDGSDFRQIILDGFEVVAVLPAEHSPGGVVPSDQAHGEVLQAVLRTFMGLRLPEPALAVDGNYVAVLEQHRSLRFDGVNYFHGYRFQAAAVIGNEDAIATYNWADLGPGFDLPTDHVPPIGAPHFDRIESDAPGLRHHEHTEPLTATLDLE